MGPRDCRSKRNESGFNRSVARGNGKFSENTEQPREAVTAMFEHPILDIGLGLVFFYVILSLVASAV